MPLHDNPTQAALYGYIAGILDGEGTFQIAKTTSQRSLDSWNMVNPKYSAKICMGMADPEAIMLLAEVLGGNTRLETTPPDRQDIYRWTLCSRLGILRVLPELLPYLRVKRKQAMLLLEYCLGFEDLRSRPEDIKAAEYQRREELYRKLKKLNAVGAAATTKREGIREDETIVWPHVKA